LDIESKLSTLAKVGKRLNMASVEWAVGASALLYLEGVTADFHDFDLIVAPDSMETTLDVFNRLGARLLPAQSPNPVYASARFVEFTLDNVDFDLLCDYTLRRNEDLYRYPFPGDRAIRAVTVQGVPVPLCPLADWFVLYQLMPGGVKKATLIAHHLKTHPRDGTRHWLGKWLNMRLPGEVRERIFTLYTELGVR